MFIYEFAKFPTEFHMPVQTCPNCTQRFSYDATCDDYVHTCYGNEARANEDIPRVDVSGWNFQGSTDKRGGKTIGIQGYPKVYSYTARGNREVTHTTRQHYETIELTGGYL